MARNDGILMKKLFILVFLLFSGFSLFADDSSFLINEVSLGTGISIYSDNTDSSRKTVLNSDNTKRIVAGLTYDASLNIARQIKIVFGADTFCDFIWDKGLYYHSLDYAFYTGIKFFPNLAGLNFSIAYSLGNRSDFYNINSETGEKTGGKNSNKAWGNGFRLALQYDFMMDKLYKVRPFIGAYYRCVPRGNYNTDHILCLNGGIRF